MSKSIQRPFAIALMELRTAVTLCCWVIGLSLLAQMVVWSLLTFTDLRYRMVEEAPTAEKTSAVLSAEDLRRQAVHEAGAEEAGMTPVEVNRQSSREDTVLRLVTGISTALGTLACAALLPLLGLAVVLAAGSATPGANRAAGAFVWAVVLVVLSLPMAQLFNDLPYDGLFAGYAGMVADVEAARGLGPSSLDSATDGGILFYGKYCVLPALCIAAITAIGVRFRAGLEDGLPLREDFRLDPELEREVAKIKTSSLHEGGRMAGALHAALQPGGQALKAPSVRQISAGDPLHRPI